MPNSSPNVDRGKEAEEKEQIGDYNTPYAWEPVARPPHQGLEGKDDSGYTVTYQLQRGISNERSIDIFNVHLVWLIRSQKCTLSIKGLSDWINLPLRPMRRVCDLRGTISDLEEPRDLATQILLAIRLLAPRTYNLARTVLAVLNPETTNKCNFY